MCKNQSGIYAITNIIDRRVYIGSTIDFNNRWGTHRHELQKGIHGNSSLQQAWDKYDEDAFEFGVLEYLNNIEELFLAEQFWMDIYREEGRELYNIALAANSPMFGRKHSKETRCRMSIVHIGTVHSKETRRRLSESMVGKQNALGCKRSKEFKRNLSESMMGKQYSLGRKQSEDHKRKIGDANAKFYPAFVHMETGEIIPAGFNLSALCRNRELARESMHYVKTGEQHSYKGWTLLKEKE